MSSNTTHDKVHHYHIAFDLYNPEDLLENGSRAFAPKRKQIPLEIGPAQTIGTFGLRPDFCPFSAFALQGSFVDRESFSFSSRSHHSHGLAERKNSFTPEFFDKFKAGEFTPKQGSHKPGIPKTVCFGVRKESFGPFLDYLRTPGHTIRPEALVDSFRTLSGFGPLNQDHGKGGLSLRVAAVTTETATTAETAKTVTAASWYCILQDVSRRRARCNPEPSKPSKLPNRHEP